jgi:hypothetical protein
MGRRLEEDDMDGEEKSKVGAGEGSYVDGTAQRKCDGLAKMGILEMHAVQLDYSLKWWEWCVGSVGK